MEKLKEKNIFAETQMMSQWSWPLTFAYNTLVDSFSLYCLTSTSALDLTQYVPNYCQGITGILCSQDRAKRTATRQHNAFSRRFLRHGSLKNVVTKHTQFKRMLLVLVSKQSVDVTYFKKTFFKSLSHPAKTHWHTTLLKLIVGTQCEFLIAFPISSGIDPPPIAIMPLSYLVQQASFFSPNSNTTGGLNVNDHIIPFSIARQRNSFPVSMFYFLN